MFTGLIEETGIVKSVGWNHKSAVIRIMARRVVEGLKTGDSISVNGACLTVVSFDGNSFAVEAMGETMNRTNLGDLKPDNAVNLERALRLGDRLGGHIVSGHIDGTGVILSFHKEDIATMVTLKADKDLLRYIIEKGSVAIDGISLTVVKVDDNSFSVGIIPHTSQETTLLKKRIDEKVNIECDMIGKYVEKIMLKGKPDEIKSRIDEKFLMENGFF